MSKTFEEIRQEATGIRDEFLPGGNPAVRVGTALADIVDKIQDFSTINNLGSFNNLYAALNAINEFHTPATLGEYIFTIANLSTHRLSVFYSGQYFVQTYTGNLMADALQSGQFISQERIRIFQRYWNGASWSDWVFILTNVLEPVSFSAPETHSGLETHSGNVLLSGRTKINHLNTLFPLYFAENRDADAVGDRRIILSYDKPEFQRCTAASTTKGAGTWIADNLSELNITNLTICQIPVAKTVQNVTISSGLIPEFGQIVWDSGRKKFLCETGLEAVKIYYQNWLIPEARITEFIYDENTPTGIIKNRLFLISGKLCIWDGSEMKGVDISGGIQNVQDFSDQIIIDSAWNNVSISLLKSGNVVSINFSGNYSSSINSGAEITLGNIDNSFIPPFEILGIATNYSNSSADFVVKLGSESPNLRIKNVGTTTIAQNAKIYAHLSYIIP